MVRWVATLVVLLGCVHDDLVVCSDGKACAPGLTCVSDPDLPYTTCATNEERAPCAGMVTHDPCELNGVPGTCFGGACVFAVCGDGILDAHETCDDGNTDGGDGCSADCRSQEACGDGTIDLAQGEQCDDGVEGRSGDGCSSQCKVEFATWTDITPSNPADRGGFQMATTPKGILLFGGSTMALPPISSAQFNDTWLFDGVTWKNMSPIDRPPPLVRGAMAYDQLHDEVVLFGGFDATATRKDQTWVWDGVNWKQRDPVNKPPPLSDASMACSPTRCVLFGGVISGNTPQNKTYEWDGTNWTTLTPTTPPSARYNAGLMYYPPHDKFLLVSQQVSSPSAMEVHELATNWTAIAQTFPPNPSTNGSPIGLAFDASLSSAMAIIDGEAWVWDGATQWTHFSRPTPAVSVYAVTDPVSHRAAVFAPLEVQTPREFTGGGTWTTLGIARPAGDLTTNSGVYDSERGVTVVLDRTTGTWEWDTLAWHQKRTSATSPPYTDIAVAYDSTCGRTVAFGGTISTTMFSGATSYYDGTAWTVATFTGDTPSPRTKAAMVYDSARDAIVLFGGIDMTTRFADTWELTGPCDARVWTKHDVPGPPGRALHAMAYDEARHVTRMFGGVVLPVGGPAPIASDDTWEWNGTAWTQLQPTTIPGKRLDHAMAFDPRTRTVVMLAGRTDPSVTTGTTLLADAWQWRGDNWVEIKSLVPFTRHAGAMLAPDRTGALMTFGGLTPSGGNINITRLDYAQIEHPVETCELGTDDLDGDGLASCADPDCRGRCAPGCATNAKLEDCTGPRCGDGVCSIVEDYLLCPADCPIKP